MKSKDEAVMQFVFLSELAPMLGVGDETLKRKAVAIGAQFLRERNPRANNVLTCAVRVEDAKRLTAEFKKASNARILSPDEISKLMEEA